MKGLLLLSTLLVLILALVTPEAFAQETECRVYTAEQEEVLRKAYDHGLPEDLGLTLAAIAEHESFIGPYIVRQNPKDVGWALRKDGTKYRVHGAYGVTQVTLATAMWLEGETNLWRAKATLAYQLTTDDSYAIDAALRKLLSVQPVATNWRHLVSMYNGGGDAAVEYSEKIAKIVNSYKKCNTEERVLAYEPSVLPNKYEDYIELNWRALDCRQEEYEV